MDKEYINILENELTKKKLRDNTKRCYLSSFKRFIRKNRDSKNNDILNNLKSIKNKTELSQVINSIRLIQDNNKNINIIPEDDLKSIIKNKSENRHKSYEPYELKDRLRRINRIRDEKLRLAYRLMIVSGLRVFEVEALIKEDIEDSLIEYISFYCTINSIPYIDIIPTRSNDLINDIAKVYLQEISKIPLLSSEEELSLKKISIRD